MKKIFKSEDSIITFNDRLEDHFPALEKVLTKLSDSISCGEDRDGHYDAEYLFTSSKKYNMSVDLLKEFGFKQVKRF